MVTMIDEQAGTNAPSPRHDYRHVTLRREQTQKVGPSLVTPPQEKGLAPRTAKVRRTQEGALKGKGMTAEVARPKEVGGTSVATEEAVLMNLRDEGELVATVSIPTDISAADLVARVTRQREDGSISVGEASDLLFPFLFQGAVYERRSVSAALRKVSTPEAILDTALRMHRFQGYEGYLNEAASLFSTFGPAAWPAIHKWAQLGGAETESLVETAFSVKDVRDAEYLAGLKQLVARGDHNTRARALGSLHMLPERIRKELLLVMAETGESDDPSRDEARERLADEFA